MRLFISTAEADGAWMGLSKLPVQCGRVTGEDEAEGAEIGPRDSPVTSQRKRSIFSSGLFEVI